DRTIAENLLREFLHSGENLLGRDGTDGDEFSGFLYDIGARKRRAFCCHCLNDIGDRRKFWALVRALSRLGTRANVCNNLADRAARGRLALSRGTWGRPGAAASRPRARREWCRGL